MKHLLMKVEGDVSDPRVVLSTFYQALSAAGANVVRVEDHFFPTQGYTAMALLEESHATVHTWPEHGYAMVDYFSCAEEPNEEDFADLWFSMGFAIAHKEVIER